MFLNASSSSLTKPLTHKTVAVLACALAMKGLANVPAAANPAVPQSTERLPSLLIVCPARLQRIEDFLCLHEIRGVEPLGEPAVDRREQIARFGAPVYGWFTEGFDTADLQEAKVLLDELASSCESG